MTATPWRTTGEAEHLSLGLTGAANTLPYGPIIMATHFITGVVVVTTETATGLIQMHGVPPSGQDDQDELDELESFAHLRRLHRDRRGGRLFRFPGSDTLAGITTVRRLVTETAIDDVDMIGHREALSPDAQVDTQSYVRPIFQQGRIVLIVRPAADGIVIPFEQPHPTPCCTDH